MAVTYAVALGLRVIGIDGGADKEKARLSMPRELFLT
jgi:D-arabinose 1-dehydrogenase-like Zn-dependent alcohol dehydrogenase